MTAQINRSRPFVDSKGALTLYGWTVMQSVWVAIGGATSSDLTAIAEQFLIEPAALPRRTEATFGDLVPGVVQRPPEGDIGPNAVRSAEAGDIAPL